MGKLKIYTDANYIDAEKIALATQKVLKQKENIYVDLAFVSQQEIQELNKKERNVDSVTDVLSFPMLNGIQGKILTKKDYPFDYDINEKAIFLGSIAICVDRAKEQAVEYCHSEEREFSYLTVHGLMHLFGYDHIIENDKKLMREKEEAVLTEIGVIE